MAAKGFRGIGRTWIEVTSDADREDYLDFLAVERDTSQQVDELSQRRGRRPGRPHSTQLGSTQENEND